MKEIENLVKEVVTQDPAYADGWRDAMKAAAAICDEILWELRDAKIDGADLCGMCSEAIRNLSM